MRTSRQFATEDHLSNSEAGNESYEYDAQRNFTPNERYCSIQHNPRNNLEPALMSNVDTVVQDTSHVVSDENYELENFPDVEMDYEVSSIQSDTDFGEAYQTSCGSESDNGSNAALNYDSEVQSQDGYDHANDQVNVNNVSINTDEEIDLEVEAINVVNSTMMLSEEERASNNESFMERALKLSLVDFLRVFALLFNPVRSGMDLLLKFLKLNWEDAAFLPTTVRTLLKTPRHTVVRDVSPGKYTHFGLLNSLEGKSNVNYEEIHRKSNGIIELILHWDGAEGVKSKKTTIWPLQVLIRGHKLRPSLVGVYYGGSKPTDFDVFLHDIVQDLISMRDEATGQDTIILRGCKFIVKRVLYLADSPAKCSALGIFSPVSFCGCTRCKIVAVHGKCYKDVTLREALLNLYLSLKLMANRYL